VTTQFKLPSSDADATATAGYMRHDSTNTAANAGGVVSFHDGTSARTVVDVGGTNYTILTKTEFLPIGWAVDGATAPSALAAVTGKEVNARSFTEADDVVLLCAHDEVFVVLILLLIDGIHILGNTGEVALGHFFLHP
jgi:hypothetical protein